MYNLNYEPTTLGYKVEEKIRQGVRERKRLNVSGIKYRPLCLEYSTPMIINKLLNVS